MRRKLDHQRIDRANAAADHLLARRLRRDSRLLRRARQNLARWMAREGKHVSSCYLEWADILDTLTRTELADFLESDTPKAKRLRQSTPFMGLVSKSEAAYIDRAYFM